MNGVSNRGESCHHLPPAFLKGGLALCRKQITFGVESNNLLKGKIPLRVHAGRSTNRGAAEVSVKPRQRHLKCRELRPHCVKCTGEPKLICIPLSSRKPKHRLGFHWYRHCTIHNTQFRCVQPQRIHGHRNQDREEQLGTGQPLGGQAILVSTSAS